MYVLSRQEMYNLDRYAIQEAGIPGGELMENAGKGCSEYIRQKLLPDTGSIIIFCGHGNNGGDGFVLARYLQEWGYNCQIVLIGDIARMSPETENNYRRCQTLMISIISVSNWQQWQQSGIDINRFDLIVDAIFGIGFRGIISGWLRDLVTEINSVPVRTLSVDMASGLDADTGKADLAIRADYTLTMAAMKYGHLLGNGRIFSGETAVIDIGIPEELFDKFPPRGKLLTPEAVIFPVRSPVSHKGDFGKIGIIAGSPGFSGAAIMAARSALRSGAGLINLYHPAGMELIFESQLLEVMTHPIPEKANGEFDLPALLRLLEPLDALLAGPGLGTTPRVQKLVQNLLNQWQKPLVLDADALNVISAERNFLPLLKNRLITPHIGEFARLCGCPVQEIISDFLDRLDKFCNEYHCCVLLKSATSIITDGREIYFNTSGNNGLATGGSGDVLAGIIISFIGQGLPYLQAAASASYLLGITAEKVASIRQPASIIPSDIIENIFKY